jgi:hypothetical protein
MSRYFAICVGAAFLFFSLAVTAQVASGNVAESSHPRGDVIDAQNPHVHRTVKGCLIRTGGDYLLTAGHSRPVRLKANDNELLNRWAGKRIKVEGNLAPAQMAEADDAGAARVSEPFREMEVERIESVAGSCPAN